MTRQAITRFDDSTFEKAGLTKIASGKVRELYELDPTSLLFVATDRLSAFDIVLDNGIPDKGTILTQLSLHWFSIIHERLPEVKTHFSKSSVSLRESVLTRFPDDIRAQLSRRSMVVRKLKVLPIESIVRGYITGSGWAEYQKSGTVHGLQLPTGLKESERLETPLWTPSTKAPAGEKDENISPAQARELLGNKHANRIEDLSLKIYTMARDYAAEKGIIIADTKLEFGLDEETDEIVLIDEVLTPDSSRFWPAAAYEAGRAQASFDKQAVRDWLTREGLKGKQGVSMTEDVVRSTHEKYVEAYERLTGDKWKV